MLVLSRAVGQSIYIGTDIVITYCGTNYHGQAKIGIDAPKHIEIYRTEIYDRIMRELREAKVP